MKIKTRLRLNTGISLVVGMLIMFSLAWSFWEIDRADRNKNLVEELRKAMAHSVYNELASPAIQQKFVFAVAPLPCGTGDPVLLRQTWNNLLSNATKYTTPRDERRIEITGHTEEGTGIYSIRDTGVGFNPKYIHKLSASSSVCINRRSLKETASASPSSNASFTATAAVPGRKEK